MPEILVQDVTVRYGSKVALDGVSVQLRDRSVSGLVGPNGSGKSTLLRVICGVEWPTRGSARVGPEHYSASASPFLRWGAFLEGGGLHPFLTARQHLTWVARASGVVEDRVDEVASLMGLRPAIDSRIRTYSLGMRQRLGIAAALLPPELELLILDEPLNGLDRGGVDLVSEVVADRSRAGATVVLATHMLSDLSKVADRVVVVDSVLPTRCASLVR